MTEKPVNLGGTIEGFPVANPIEGSGSVPANLSPKEIFQSLGTGQYQGRQPIPISSFQTGDRFKSSLPGTDTEEMVAQMQSNWDRTANGVLKMGGTFLTSFTSGTVGVIYGLGKSLVDQRFSSLFDNELTRKLDEISQSLENTLPNYYTHEEKDADWWTPDNLMTANFWADKVVKNIGYSIGAIAGGVGWGSVIKGIGATNRLIKAGKALELINATENIMTTVPRAQQWSALQSTLSSLSQTLVKTPTAALLKNSDRIIASAMGTFGEASIEALHSLNHYRDQLISEYKAKNGVAPTGEDLDEINQYADKVGNFVWGFNTLLLTGTNYIMLPKILGSSRKLDKALINNIVKDEATGQFIAPRSFLRSASSTAGLFFSKTEAFEEGSQYAIEKGVSHYFNRAYQNKEQVGNFLNDLSGAFKGTINEGLNRVLTDKEGMESLLIGGITGALMTARGNIKERSERRKNTDIALSILNSDKSNIQNVLKDQVNYLNRAINSQQLRQQAIAQNDILNEKDYELDYLMSYILPRIKYGKLESINQELDLYLDQASTEEGFNQLKADGIVAEWETRDKFIDRIQSIKTIAQNSNSLYEQINDRYSNVVNKEGERLYTPDVVDKMVYSAAKVKDYDQRILNLTEPLVSVGVDVQSILDGVIKNGTPPKRFIEKALSEIDKLNSISEDELKDTLRDVVELSLRRKDFVDTYNNIKAFPQNYKEVEKLLEPEVVDFEGVVSPLEVGREYELPLEKEAIIRQREDNRFEVIFPTKENAFYDTKEEAEDAKNEYNQDIKDLKKVKVLATNPDGSVRIQDVNGDVYDISPDRLNFYNRVLTAQEKLAKSKSDLDKELDEVYSGSGNTYTNSPENDFNLVQTEDKRKSTEELFVSTTGISEDRESENIKPHHLRAITFLNNAQNFPNRNKLRVILLTQNQEKALGLDGIVALSNENSGEDPAKYTDINTGTVIAVYVEQDKNKVYFVNQEGKRIGKLGETTDLNQVVFSTMPTTHLFWRDGKTARFREGEQEDATLEAKKWEAKRTQLFAAKNHGGIYKFDISRGIPIESENNEQYSVSESLIPENVISEEEGLIFIPTTGVVSHKGKLLKYPNGRPVLQYKDTLQFINNRNLNSSQVDTIYEILNRISNSIKEQSEKGEKIVINKKYTRFLQNIIFFGPQKQGKPFGTNQAFIDTNTMELRIGDKRFDITNVEGNKNEILEQLSKTYNSVNNFTLTKEFNNHFIELYLEDGEIKERKWKNYQTYLLSGKNPDGSKRLIKDIPLTTNVVPKTEAVPYNYKQKYAVLQELDLPEVAIKPAKIEVQQDKLTVGDYVIDGTTLNTFNLKSGPVQFTATFEDNEFVVSVEENETIIKISVDDNLMKVVTDNLKSLNKFDATKSDKELALDFVALQISANLKSVFSAKKEEPAQEQKPAEVKLETPVTSDIEAKKADIEKRRQEELNKGSLPNVPDYVKEEIDRNVKTNQNLLQMVRELAYQNKTKSEIAKELNVDKEIINSLRTYLQIPSMDSKTEFSEWKSKIDKINAKYDAELAELEGKGVKKEFKKVKRLPGTEYKIATTSNVDRITEKDLEIFRKWHQENVPGIPFKVLLNIVTTHDGKKAWGVFENNVAKFFKSAQKGTEYHEIFEGIWAAFLTEEERQQLLDEFKSNFGTFTDEATGKKIEYSQATDRQAKERIADDFMEFRLGKIKAKSLTDKILDFFRSIINFFKSFVQKPTLKDQLFEQIDKGRFKESKIEVTPSPFSEYKLIPGLNEQQINEFVQDITARSMSIIFSTDRSLFNIEELTAPEVFEPIREMYVEAGYIEEGNPDVLSNAQFDDLVKRTNDFLYSTFSIKFDEEGYISINDETVDRTLYAPEAFTVDFKKHSPYPVKIVVGTLPDVKNPTEDGKITLLNFSRAFATLMNKLSNKTRVNKFTEALGKLAQEDENYLRAFKRIGGNENTWEVDYNSFDYNNWRLFIQFYQTFSKQNPNAYIQYKNEGNVYTALADQFTATKQLRESWVSNLRTLSQKKDSIVKYDKSKKVFKVEDLSKFPIKDNEQMVNFLGKIGVNFELSIAEELNEKDLKKFQKTVVSIHSYLGKNPDIMSITGKNLAIEGSLTTLAELYTKVTNPNQDLSYFGLDRKRRQSQSENNAASLLENDFNSVSTLDELLEVRPELNDVFSKNSQVLKKGGLFFDEEGNRTSLQLKVSYIQGQEDQDKGKSITQSKLSLGDRYSIEINQNLNGKYYIIVPADSSTEWEMELSNTIDYDDIQSGEAWNRIYTIFRGYLLDDINLAKDQRGYLRNVGKKAKDLRFFKDILPEKVLTKINDLISEDAPISDIEAYIDNNISDINSAVKEYISTYTEDTVQLLKDHNQLIAVDENKFAYPNLDSDFSAKKEINKYDLSQKEINDLLTFANVNYIINNIEFHKILFGDPYQFAIKEGKLDETKRIKSFLSPRRTTFDSKELNNFLNTNFNKIGDIKLLEGDPGYHRFKSYINTVTFADINIRGSITNIESLPKSLRNEFSDVNETDAFSIMIDNTFRENMIKNGQWSDEAEDFHQWHMAYTRLHIPGYEYSKPKLKERDIETVAKPIPEYTLHVIKPIVSGTKYNKNHIDNVLDKMSQMPIYYHMVEGTDLEKLYIQMFKQDIGYGVFESGRKVGIEETHSLYNENGTFNNTDFNNVVQVPWKAYGIQQETAYDGPKEQTRGSQITKLSSLDLYSNGEPTSQRAKELYERNVKILNEMHWNAYQNLLSDLGIEDNNGSFSLIDKPTVSQTLKREMLRREASENLKDTLELDENGEFRIPFEASSAYIQIRDILYSMVDKALISPKMSGSSHVQVPSSLWEKSGKGRKTVEINGKKVFTSSELKFYTKEDPYMEVLLPAWFRDQLPKGKFKTEEDLLNYLNRSVEGKEILKGIGFRIPTQSLSSIENVKVKGFLPAYMGTTIVVPSEITKKAGSDFDIDKLNMYLKAVFVDQNGDIRLIKYMGSEQDTKDHYSKVFDKIVEKRIFKKQELSEAIQLLQLGKEQAQKLDTKGLINKYANYLNELVQEEEDLYAKSQDLLDEISELTDEQIQQIEKQKFIRRMYKGAIENEYYKVLDDMLRLPENFERLISPVGDAGLSKLAEKLDYLKQDKGEKTPNRILNRNYLTKLRHAFITGKKWVGIAAVNITGHSLTQKSEIFIDVSKFGNLPIFDQKILKDGSVVLPHNKTRDGNISISGKMTANGKEYISDRLSGYATSFVDIAKDPYILKLIHSDLTVGTFMFLERIGAGETVAMFMNQPIIERYVQHLDSLNKKGLYSKSEIEKIKSEFPTTEKLLQDAVINIKDFSNNIETFYEKGKLTATENAVQHKILDEFLKYSKMAEYSFKLTQASNYDTTRYRSQAQLFKKQTLTVDARENNIFSSIDDLLEQSHIGEQAKLLGYSTESIGEILKLDNYEFSNYINPILEPLAKKPYFSNDDYMKVANKVVSSFLDYIIQTKSGLNLRLNELLVNTETSVATKVLAAKKKYPNNKLLQDIEIINLPRPESVNSLKLKVNLKGKYDQDLYTEMFRELKALLPNLYKDIVSLSILQGTPQSAISFGNVIPIEDRAKVITPIINSLSASSELEAFSKGAFQRNNWKDEDVFHRMEPRFFFTNVMGEKLDTPIGEDMYGNDIFQYQSPAFPTGGIVKALGLKPSDRKIMILNETYDSFHIQNDYILVPRVVKTKEVTADSLDIMTGRTITKSMFKQRSLKGDMSLKEVLGYQKVRDNLGNPVTFVDKKGNTNYIYKLINLWGDGMLASEYYSEFRPSVLNNGTVKIAEEIQDRDIIDYYSPEIQKEPISLQETVTEQPAMGPKVDTTASWFVLKNQPVYTEQGVREEYKWARYSDNSYEVSSQGDKRFSALYAKLKDGRTIEEAYQLDVKGYRTKGNNWKLGKGKAPIRNITKEQQWNEYKDLWRTYLNENPELLKDLQEKAKGKVLTDKFASTDISQARALSEILNEQQPTTSQPLLVNTMRTTNKEAEYAHFGNPWSEGGYSGTIKTKTVQEAWQNYKDWLLTDKFTNIKPKQRDWILKQINSGKLDNATLLYDGKLAARRLGTHAHALAEVIQQLRGKENMSPKTEDQSNQLSLFGDDQIPC